MKRGTAINLHNVIDSAVLSQLATCDKCRVLDILRVLKPVSKEWAEFSKTIEEKTKTKEMTVEEANRYINEKFDEEIEIKVPQLLSRDSFEKLIESNKEWTAGIILLIEDNIVAKK